jgi:hypothetical protein
MEKKYCPVNGWDCPYYLEDGSCELEHPEEDCDDYAAMEMCLNDDSPDIIWMFGL